jgi:hypothetical protein
MTTALKQAIILVEHDGLAVAILDHHALNDGDSTAVLATERTGYTVRDLQRVLQSQRYCCRSPTGAEARQAEVLIATVEALLPEPV